MKRNILEFWVGLFVLAGAAALGFLSLRVAGGGGFGGGASQGYTVYAEFSDIGGLKTQAPIKASGVLVGRVQSITLTRRPIAPKSPCNWTNSTSSAATFPRKSSPPAFWANNTSA